MTYAIVEIGGKQYKVAEGNVLEIDKLDIEAGKTYNFEKILLYSSDGQSQIGKPLVSGITVSGKILEHVKGDKIRVAKFKAKSRYRRAQGFRPSLTRIKIETITSSHQSRAENEKKPETKKEAKTKKAKSA